MKTATIKDINEERKKPIPTNSGPIFPKIYEKNMLLTNNVPERTIDCSLKSKYRNSVIIVETNIAEKEAKNRQG